MCRILRKLAILLTLVSASLAQTTTFGSGSGTGTFTVGSGSGSGTFNLAGSTPGPTCGPPFYPCANTTVNLIANATTPFGGLFGANSVVTPNDFNAPMTRITDAGTLSDHLDFSFCTYDSADVNEMNADDSFLGLRNCEGGNTRVLLYHFVPATMQSSRLYPAQPGGGIIVAGAGFFGYTLADKNLYFFQPINSTQIDYQDLTNACNPTCASPSNPPAAPVVLHDFGTDCVSGSGTPTWIDDGSTDKAGDNWFLAAYSFTGGQGTGKDVCLYNRSANNSCHLDTSTGVVSGAGCSSTGTVNLPDRWTIHNVKHSRGASPGYSVITPTTCTYTIPLSLAATDTIVGTTATMTLQATYTGTIGAFVTVTGVTGGAGASGLNCTNCTVTGVAGAVVTYTLKTSPGNFSGTVTGGQTTACGYGSSDVFWQDGTTTLLYAAQPPNADGGGHFCNGTTNYFNNAGNPGGNYDIRPYATPTSFSRLIPGGDFPAGGAQAQVDQHCSYNNADSLDTYPIVASTAAFTGAGILKAWTNEIICVNPNGVSPVCRLGHNFITGQSQFFDAQYGLGSTSPDGKFFIFASDWMGGVGSSSGHGTCTIGVDCRADVGVLKLQ
jgi:hypothetical protein